MLTPKMQLPAEQRQLLKHYSRLDQVQRATLMAFAEFLVQREAAQDDKEGAAVTAPVEVPKPLPRPSRESVVGAIKRLSQTYHMLDRSKMLDETSALMSAHIMQGREAAAVIDDLESLFRNYYETYAGHGD